MCVCVLMHLEFEFKHETKRNERNGEQGKVMIVKHSPMLEKKGNKTLESVILQTMNWMQRQIKYF